MEDKTTPLNNNNEDDQEQDYVLSFCDLPTYVYTTPAESPELGWKTVPTSPTIENLFEFSTVANFIDTIRFPLDDSVVSYLDLDALRPRALSQLKCKSFIDHICARPSDLYGVKQKRSTSLRSPETGVYRCRGCSSKKRGLVVFGVTKFRPDMELSEIKKRQKGAIPLFPAVGNRELENSGEIRSRRKQDCPPCRPSRFSGLLDKVLRKLSFGCEFSVEPHVNL